ncbi:hypothetical protein M8J77_016307 [Diaphorina citri]|nr:hypothetical protein M8J77_016307 [Diaphorina citri]
MSRKLEICRGRSPFCDSAEFSACRNASHESMNSQNWQFYESTLHTSRESPVKMVLKTAMINLFRIQLKLSCRHHYLSRIHLDLLTREID